MSVKSAIVDNEVFIQGEYLSIGINRDGSLGTRKGAPAGFNSDIDSGFLRVGMFADLDGFGRGAVTTLNDAVLPGRTIEGFNIGYKMGGATIVHSNQSLTGYSEILGVNSDASTASVGQTNWKGVTTEKLDVSQKITLLDDAKYIRIDVTLTNNSSSTMSDLRYMRTADPDQGPTFSTTNKIVRQGEGGALVGSYVGASSTPFFLYSADKRAVVSTYGFVNTDPYAAAAWSSKQAVGYSKAADETVNLTFALGNLAAGQSATVTLYMGVTDDLAKTVAAIDAGGSTTPSTVNLAPVVGDDSLVVGGVGKGNVLANDRDPEGGKLTAILKSGPGNGAVSLAADGSFTYTPKAGFSGSDSFTYAASDGENESVATVTLTVKATPGPSPLLSRAGTVDGSSSASQTLSGPEYHNSFYFDVAATSGRDRISNFRDDDVLVVNRALYDGNGDGIIGLTASKLSLDGSPAGDVVEIAGVSALRFLGSDAHGMLVYGDASVRPKGAIEGRLGQDRLSGDALDTKKDVFFYDTALDIHLGADRIDSFGKRDVIVTTSALADGNRDGVITFSGGVLKLVGGVNGPGDLPIPGEAGTVALFGVGGGAINSLEFDGSVVRDGTTYYVYSSIGSAAGVADVAF